MNLTEQMISRVFYDRNFAHLEHWKTSSYAQHEAFGEFYSSVIDKIDTFVEARQGILGLVGDVKDHKPSITNPTALRCMSDTAKWLAENRNAICEDIEALENVVDEIVGLYLKTIYKLKHLK